MKKLLFLLLVFTLLLSGISGCGVKVKSDSAADGKKAADSVEGNKGEGTAELKEAMDELGDALEVLAVKGWPKDKVPEGMPEYTGGEVVNSGGSDDELYIKIEGSNKEELGKYLEELKNAGWNVSEEPNQEIRKGIYDVEFDWQGSNMLQMCIRTSEVSAWPKDKLPPDIFPPENCTFIGELDVIENTENSWYFNYECDGVDEAAANKYVEKLIENGWEGDISQLCKEFEWKGKKYSATIELYEIVGNSSTFTCNFGIYE